jgi:hypothetical protein
MVNLLGCDLDGNSKVTEGRDSHNQQSLVMPKAGVPKAETLFNGRPQIGQ